MARTELHPPGEDGKDPDKRKGVIFEDEEPVMLHLTYIPITKDKKGNIMGITKKPEEIQKFRLKAKEPEIEARLKELGVMKKEGRSWVVPHMDLLRIISEYHNNFNAVRNQVTADEVAYALFLYQVKEPAERKKVAYLSYFLTPLVSLTLVKKQEGKEHKKPGKFRRSGHLTDQILKYTYPKDKDQQLAFNWDGLPEIDKQLIEKQGIQRSELVEGIRLSPSVHKLIDCLSKMLHEKSQNTDPEGENYFTGNKDFDIMQYGPDKDTPAPKLAFTIYELAKEYKGGEYVSGKDIDNVKSILQELDKQRFLISYIETVPTKGGGRIENKIEGFKRLIEILKISQTLYSKEDIELSKKEETVIVLNPIFRRQIYNKCILYPSDINRRTIIAYGSHNLSETVIRLRDYLAREMSQKRYSPEIYQDRLYYMLNEKWMNEGRKKKVKEFTDKALETCKTMGMIKEYKIEPGATGEPKVIFTLNKKWE